MSKVINLSKLRRRRISKTVYKKQVVHQQRTPILSFRLCLAVLSIMAIFIGSLIFSKYEISFVTNYLLNLVKSLQNDSALYVLKKLILPEILTFALCLIFGTNILGSSFIIFVPVIKLSIFGYLGALMYSNFELNGVLFSLIFLVPFFAASGTVLIILSNESYQMSKTLNMAVVQRKTAKDGSLQLFLVRFMILLFIDILFVVMNSFLIASFSSKIILQ